MLEKELTLITLSHGQADKGKSHSYEYMDTKPFRALKQAWGTCGSWAPFYSWNKASTCWHSGEETQISNQLLISISTDGATSVSGIWKV